MSKFSLFMKQNKIVTGNTSYVATKSLCDENGKPLEWTIRHLTSKENDDIRDSCTYDVPVTGKPNMYRSKLNTAKYILKLVCASVVEPNLFDKDLQNSYGVMTPEDLLQEMVDNPGEYQDFAAYIQKMNGFDTSLDEKVEQAKN